MRTDEAKLKNMLIHAGAKNIDQQIENLYEKFIGANQDKKRSDMIQGYSGEIIFNTISIQNDVYLTFNNGSSIDAMYLGNDSKLMYNMDFEYNGFYIDVKTSTVDSLWGGQFRNFPANRCPYTVTKSTLERYLNSYGKKAWIVYIIFDNLYNMKINKAFAFNIEDTLNSLHTKNNRVIYFNLTNRGELLINPDKQYSLEEFFQEIKW